MHAAFVMQQELFDELPRLTRSITINDELFHLLTNAFDEGKLRGTTFPGKVVWETMCGPTKKTFVIH